MLSFVFSKNAVAVCVCEYNWKISEWPLESGNTVTDLWLLLLFSGYLTVLLKIAEGASLSEFIMLKLVCIIFVTASLNSGAGV